MVVLCLERNRREVVIWNIEEKVGWQKLCLTHFNFYKYMVNINSEKFSRVLNMFLAQIRENNYVYL